MDQYRDVIDQMFGGIHGAVERLELIDTELNRFFEWRKIVSLYFHDFRAGNFEELIENNPEAFFLLARQAERIKSTPTKFKRT